MSEILIKKENGELERFDGGKLRQSLLNSDSSIILADSIVQEIEKELKPETSTNAIYAKAFEILRREEKPTALRYSIRRSILSLGPSGFPFEKFIEKVFQKKGYKTMVGQTLQGKCVEHEIDVVAVSPKDELILTEIKFHNELFLKSDTKVVLYIKARFDDLKDQKFNFFGKELKPKRILVVTNTKFTENAIKYAECAGLDIISWEYPKKGNLYNLVHETDTYPITILESISNSKKADLISQNIITCEDFIKSDAISALKPSEISEIKAEVESINAK